MPIYEYKCPQCEHELEIEKKIKDVEPVICPQCLNDSNMEKAGSNWVQMVRQISLGGFTLKGKGWYKTDYGKKP